MTIAIKRRGFCDYQTTLREMRELTDNRTADNIDELWLLQHPPVYTLGQSGERKHILSPGAIPIVHSDRGGQATYHGPGQVIAYLMLDLRRRQLGARKLVRLLQLTVVELLAGFDIFAAADAAAPGVYVGGKKIAALGLRVRRGCCYHGISVNVQMDLSPFDGINIFAVMKNDGYAERFAPPTRRSQNRAQPDKNNAVPENAKLFQRFALFHW